MITTTNYNEILWYYFIMNTKWLYEYNNNYIYTKTKVMTTETKVMDTIFDIIILTQLVHSESILNLNKVLFKTNKYPVL